MIVFVHLVYAGQRLQFRDLLLDFGIVASPCEKPGQVIFSVPRWSGTDDQFLDFLFWLGRRFEIPIQEVKIIRLRTGQTFDGIRG